MVLTVVLPIHVNRSKAVHSRNAALSMLSICRDVPSNVNRFKPVHNLKASSPMFTITLSSATFTRFSFSAFMAA